MTDVEATRDDPEKLAIELLASMKAVRRRVQRIPGPQGLLSTQSELLRLIVDRPPVSVAGLASILHVAPNTLSTLLGQLVDLGLIVRRRDPSDLRVALYEATDAGRERVITARDHRAAAVTAALHEMRSSERKSLAEAVLALQTLAELLT